MSDWGPVVDILGDILEALEALLSTKWGIWILLAVLLIGGVLWFVFS